MLLRFNKATGHTSKRRGFTLVELLIVIVVIAILAAITIIAYNGITQKANAAALTSDLSQAYTSLGLIHATNDLYPDTQGEANLKSSPGITLSYTMGGSWIGGSYYWNTTYCLQAIGFGQVYAITNDSNVPTQGYCSYGRIESGIGDASLGYPDGITVSSSGTFYIIDNNDNCIRTVASSTANLTTLAGICGATNGTADGTGATAQFDYPEDAIVDTSGNLYVTDSYNNCIRKVTASAVVTTFAGTCKSTLAGSGTTNGTGTAARFNYPQGIATDTSGNLYIADTANNCIRKITPAAVVTTFAGTCNANLNVSMGTTDGTGAAAKFDFPTGITIDSSGNVYVSDAGSNCIRKITPAAVVTTFAGTCNITGSSYGTTDGTGAAAQFNYPADIVANTSGIIYVVDNDNQCIRKITPTAVVSTLAGTCGSPSGTTDGTGATAQFNYPWGITVDSSGTVYVADTNNNCIRKITSAGVVTAFTATTCGT